MGSKAVLVWICALALLLQCSFGQVERQRQARRPFVNRSPVNPPRPQPLANTVMDGQSYAGMQILDAKSLAKPGTPVDFVASNLGGNQLSSGVEAASVVVGTTGVGSAAPSPIPDLPRGAYGATAQWPRKPTAQELTRTVNQAVAQLTPQIAATSAADPNANLKAAQNIVSQVQPENAAYVQQALEAVAKIQARQEDTLARREARKDAKREAKRQRMCRRKKRC